MSSLVRDTIAAQATPPGFGGIAIIRISGPLVRDIMQAVLNTALPPRQATLLAFLDEHHEKIDEGIALFFPAPHSFTGEDILELQGHGGPVVVTLILKRLVALGARLARAGEFSERAFLNGKLDLTQAEAISDLIHATSTQAARSAMRSLQGDFSKAIHILIEKVIRVRMYIEAAIDFTDEEIDFLNDVALKQQLTDITDFLAATIAQAKQGQLLREGISVVIAGEPNVGKSSLINALSAQDIAIVTDRPGTTRDILRQHILLDGLPLHIIDTAGLRESDDVIEQEGIRRAHVEIKQADLILYVVSATDNITAPTNLRKKLHANNTPIIIVRNKIDLTNELPTLTQDSVAMVNMSVKEGAGLDLLKVAIKQQAGFHTESDGTYIARERHLMALHAAKKYIETSEMELANGAGELAAENLRLAQLALNEITGEFSADDLLGRIFSNFCIGK